MPPLKTVTGERAAPAKGRGATLNPEGRFEELRREEFDDGWDTPLPEEPARPRTTVTPEKAKSLIQRNESPDVPFNFSINPYRGCEHGCIYCMAGDTPILMGDGRTRPLAELRVGDVVYGTARQGWYRRYVKTRVLAHWRTIKPAYRIILQDGTRLVAGGDHRFLTERGWKFVSERHACDGGRRPHLTTGDKLMGTGAFASPPAKNEDYRREHLRFFHTVDPAITRKLEIVGQALKSSVRSGVSSIESLGGAQVLYDITTETGDFIANGVVSHNCYARPSHAYLELSPGLDFETRLFAKVNATEILREELARPSYRCESITIGANTDPYQPIEREWKITRQVLELLAACEHPCSIITKNALVERDLDLLAPMAQRNLVQVFLSVTTLDHELARRLEPRASAPRRRVEAIGNLAAAGVPVGVMVAPVIPFLTDSGIEAVLEAAAQAGAKSAGYTLMRLPWELKELFKDWLQHNYPLKADHVMSRVRQMRKGKENDPNFGSRHRGEGLLAELLEKRFEIACNRFGLNRERRKPLEVTRFKPPARNGQMDLF